MSSSARRTLQILAAVGDSARPLGVTEIARAIGVAPGTAFRGVDALHRAGFLARHAASPRYALGAQALAARQTLLSLFPIREVCLPYLRQLASASGEATSLHVRVGWYAVRIATAPGASDVTMGASQSAVQPLGAECAGRTVLAHFSSNEIRRYLAWAKARRLDPSGDVEPALARIRADRFASSPQDGPSGIALPIRKSNQAFAAISSDASLAHGRPSERRAPAKLSEVVRALENLIRTKPALGDQPFQHIDPEEIVLPS
jgi:IclR family acetate operon transcriptional repressor